MSAQTWLSQATLAALVFVVAGFSQLFVGHIVDRHRIKPILVTVALGQPVLIGLMALHTDYALFVSTFLAVAFVFGQIPITDVVLSQYVPDVWRTKALSVKFMLNLVLGSLALMTARYILASHGGFGMVMIDVGGGSLLYRISGPAPTFNFQLRIGPFNRAVNPRLRREPPRVLIRGTAAMGGCLHRSF